MKLTKKVLHLRSRPVQFHFPYQNQILARDMVSVMLQHQAIGLAATQIGKTLRLFVMRVNGLTRCCFNPQIVDIDTKLIQYDEGCLSFPGKHCIINRPGDVSVQYQDAEGAWYTEKYTGLMSRCFQHELDHLDGITIWDRYKEQHAEQF